MGACIPRSPGKDEPVEFESFDAPRGATAQVDPRAVVRLGSGTTPTLQDACVHVIALHFHQLRDLAVEVLPDELVERVFAHLDVAGLLSLEQLSSLVSATSERLALSHFRYLRRPDIQPLLVQCRSLTYLDVAGCACLNDEDIAAVVLANSSLTHVDIAGCGAASSRTLDAICAACTALKTLNIGRTQISGEALAARMLPSTLESLNLDRIPNFSESNVPAFLTPARLPNLTALSLEGARMKLDWTLRDFPLQSLCIENCEWDDRFLPRAASHPLPSMAALRTLRTKAIKLADSMEMADLGAFSALETLSISLKLPPSCRIGAYHVCANLTELDMVADGVPRDLDAALPLLRKLTLLVHTPLRRANWKDSSSDDDDDDEGAKAAGPPAAPRLRLPLLEACTLIGTCAVGVRIECPKLERLSASPLLGPDVLRSALVSASGALKSVEIEFALQYDEDDIVLVAQALVECPAPRLHRILMGGLDRLNYPAAVAALDRLREAKPWLQLMEGF